MNRFEYLGDGVGARADKCVILGAFRQTGPHWVLQDVSGNTQRRFVTAQGAFESIPLPQSLSEHLLEVEPRELLRARDEPSTVRVIGQALNQKVDVVRHEAVCKKCNALVVRGTLNLREYGPDASRRHEYVTSLVRAERQKIPIETEIAERLEVFGFSGEHTEREAKRGPGPAEAGHYVRERQVRLKPDTTYGNVRSG